jgi:hypothetical protein
MNRLGLYLLPIQAAAYCRLFPSVGVIRRLSKDDNDDAGRSASGYPALSFTATYSFSLCSSRMVVLPSSLSRYMGTNLLLNFISP